MSLSFNFTQCPFYKTDEMHPKYGWQVDEETGADYVAPITKALTLSTISVGLGHITEKNVEEFYARMILLDKLWGIATFKMLDEYDNGSGWIDYTISPDDVRQHIGLVTNVANESREAWCRRMFQNKGTSVLRDYMQDYHRGIEKADKYREEMTEEV